MDVVKASNDDLSSEQRLGVLAAGLIPGPLSLKLRKQAVENFQDAEIDKSPRVLTAVEGSALYLGLVIINLINDDLKTKYQLISNGGGNIHAVFLNRINLKKSRSYYRQLRHAMDTDLVKDFDEDES